MSFQLVARILRSRALTAQYARYDVRTTLLSSKQRQAPQRVNHHWLSTSKEDHSLETRNAEPWKTTSDHQDAVGKDADLMLAEIRKSIHRNVARILSQQPLVKRDWKRNLQQLERTQYSKEPWDNTASHKTDPWSTPENAPYETSSYAKLNEGYPWDAPAENALHGANVSKTSNMSKVSVSDTSAKLNEGYLLDVRAEDALHGTDVSKDPQISKVAAERREQPSLLELLRQPLEDESLVIKDGTAVSYASRPSSSQPSSLLDLLNDDSATASALATTKSSVRIDKESIDRKMPALDLISSDASQSALSPDPSHPSPIIDLLKDDTDNPVETPIEDSRTLEYTVRFSDDVPGELSTSWTNDTDFRGDSMATQRATQPQSLTDMLRQPIEDESPPIGDENRHVASSAGETPKVRFEEGGTRPVMPAYDFGDLWNDAIPALESLDVLVDEEEDESKPAPENWNDIWQADLTDLGDNTVNQAHSSAMDEGLAILLAMKDSDWEQLEDVAEFLKEESPLEDEVIEIELESDSESEENSDEGEKDKLTYLDDKEDDVSLLGDIRDLLEWTSFGDIILSTADYNAVLLQLATSSLPTNEAIKMMVTTYRHMLELGRSGTDCAPDATTYTILMVALDRRAKAPSSAAGICREMMNSDIKVSPEALIQGIRCLQRRSNVQDAERLFNSVHNSESHETAVPAAAWLGLLQIYKHLDMQSEAVELVSRCITANVGKDDRCITKVITAAIYWPRKDFRGRRINSSQLLTKMVDLLESNSPGREGDDGMDKRDEGIVKEAELRDSSWNGPADDAGVRSVQRSEYDWSKQSYMPSYKAWTQLILSLSMAAEAKAGADWPLVRRAFTAMQNSLGDCWPDARILKVGLRTAEMTRDADLASNLIIRAQDEEFQVTHDSDADSLWINNQKGVGHLESVDLHSDVFGVEGSDDMSASMDISLHESVGDNDNSDTQEVELLFDLDVNTPDERTTPSFQPRRNSVRATPQAFASAMRLSVATGNMTSAEKLLGCLRDPRNTFPSSVKSELYTLAMKGYAKVGDSDTALNLLKEMQNDGPKPTEEAYGTVIHSLAVSKRTEEAGELFLSMDSGQLRDKISPGRTCFDGRMLAYMEANEWEETLAFHSKMKEAGIPWSPLRFQGVLLASFRLGGRAKALEAIEGALGSGMKMDHNCCEMSIRIILGDVLKTGIIQQVRTKLRHIGEQNRFLQTTSLNLSRALRAAEVEERRQPTDGLKLQEIVSRRDQAWNSALKHLVHFARAIENEDSEIIASN